MTKKHDIIWLDTTDSTNEEARRRIRDIDNLSVVSAYSQTAGRGQRGNIWSSAPGQNLTFSIIIKYGHGAGQLLPLRACDQFAISEAAALAVVDLLASHDIEAKIKWPNDIYVGDRKICGILIENSLRESFMSSSIIGIGLNVNQTEFDPSLPNPTSMALCSQSAPLEALLEEFIDIFKSYCSRFLNIAGGLSHLRRLYLSQLWCLNEFSSFIDYTDLPSGHISGISGREFKGIIRGITATGKLLVDDLTETPPHTREFSFKEIGYIIHA